jgi:hypothetical protein
MERIKTPEELIAEANALLDQQISTKEESDVEKLVNEIIAKDEIITGLNDDNRTLRSKLFDYETEEQKRRDNNALSINEKYKAIDTEMLSEPVRQVLADDAFLILLVSAKNLSKQQKQQLFGEMI